MHLSIHVLFCFFPAIFWQGFYMGLIRGLASTTLYIPAVMGG